MTNEGPWRFYMKLKSRKALREYMDFHGIKTAYALARKANLGVAIVGHLVNNRRDTCSAATAAAIEKALQCPPGFLFEPQMSRVADDKRAKSAA
jgi:hypothetical protein